MINRKFFFDHVRAELFGGQLSQSQVDGMVTVLDEWEEKYSKEDDRWLAYMLATIYHETARTMQPIHEIGGDAYFFKMYDPKGSRPQVAAMLGNTKNGDGVLFHGRGFVQLTGRRNYEKMGKLLKVNLVSQPDLALETKIATQILFIGMKDGIFTGKKLEDYLSPMIDDWVQARKIINGLDKADTIVGYGHKFYAAIGYTTV